MSTRSATLPRRHRLSRRAFDVTMLFLRYAAARYRRLILSSMTLLPSSCCADFRIVAASLRLRFAATPDDIFAQLTLRRQRAAAISPRRAAICAAIDAADATPLLRAICDHRRFMP
jgi:hypothetical protein